MPRSRGNTQLDVTMTHNVVMSTLKRNALFGYEVAMTTKSVKFV